MANRLANEISPYLLQHANNPVDWYPWGEEALERARAEDRPIFLSVGYSSCHWCHVMAHESFEDEQVAEILNQNFVSIKVDREERPDIDQIYMAALQAMTGGGGWPMSLFLTPEGQPFFAGTYFPPRFSHGTHSFTDVLTSVIDAWQYRREELLQGSEQIVAALRAHGEELEGATVEVGQETLARAYETILHDFDTARGGWGEGPKFPQPMVLEFLLRHHLTTGLSEPLEMATHSLDAMARGGIYDQLGGGFHRYSVDGNWLVPHFEKMLYDNAQLARVYLHGWQLTNDPFFRAVAEETIDFVLREMAAPSGGFYSTLDADSEGREGWFYLWDEAEIGQLLGDDAGPFIAAYGVGDGGNFEGRNILTLEGDDEERAALAGSRAKLLAAREKRVRPGRDEKVLASWNGLMLGTLAEAARAFKRDDYLQAAERSAGFLLREMRNAEGRMFHNWKDGSSRIDGFLEDYTHVMDGLLELYQTTFDPRWYRAARELAEVVIEHFSAPVGFFDTGDDHETLILRPRDVQDNTVPSGNSMAATVLPRLAGLAVNLRYARLAAAAVGSVGSLLERWPLGFGQWLVAADYLASRPKEVAVVGRRGATDTVALLDRCTTGYRPHQVVAFGEPEAHPEPPLLEGRGEIGGHAAAYVCVDVTCQPPVTEPAELEGLLG